MTATRSRASAGQADGRVERTRTLGTARLPNGRALLGALLVVGAGLGVYLGHRAATSPPDTRWLVATSAITAGTRIRADQLGLDTMSIGSVEPMAFADPDEVIGRMALESIDEGELVQRSDLAADGLSSQGAPARAVTLSLPSGRALAGQLADGQLVDVLATGDTADSTRVIARDALVTRVGGMNDSESIGNAAEIQITLVLPEEETAAAVVDAHETGALTLITPSRIEVDSTSIGSR